MARAAACGLLADSIIHAHKEAPEALVCYAAVKCCAAQRWSGGDAYRPTQTTLTFIFANRPDFQLPPGAKQLYKDRQSVYSEHAVHSAIGMVRVALSRASEPLCRFSGSTPRRDFVGRRSQEVCHRGKTTSRNRLSRHLRSLLEKQLPRPDNWRVRLPGKRNAVNYLTDPEISNGCTGRRHPAQPCGQ